VTLAGWGEERVWWCLDHGADLFLKLDSSKTRRPGDSTDKSPVSDVGSWWKGESQFGDKHSAPGKKGKMVESRQAMRRRRKRRRRRRKRRRRRRRGGFLGSRKGRMEEGEELKMRVLS
jgi:hypothetical protein